MNYLVKISAVAALVMIGAFVFVAFRPSVAYAQDQQTDQNQADENTSTYNYVAQSGDSYSKMARKAVQTYGINKQVNLSGAQIVAAETFLTTDADSPELNIGEEVKVSESAVDAAVKKA